MTTLFFVLHEHFRASDIDWILVRITDRMTSFGSVWNSFQWSDLCFLSLSRSKAQRESGSSGQAKLRAVCRPGHPVMLLLCTVTTTNLELVLQSETNDDGMIAS